MKTFEMTPLHFPNGSLTFTEETAPKWLREGGHPGSTMDMRWYWNDHILTLEVGESIRTDFQEIRRTA